MYSETLLDTLDYHILFTSHKFQCVLEASNFCSFIGTFCSLLSWVRMKGYLTGHMSVLMYYYVSKIALKKTLFTVTSICFPLSFDNSKIDWAIIPFWHLFGFLCTVALQLVSFRSTVNILRLYFIAFLGRSWLILLSS